VEIGRNQRRLSTESANECNPTVRLLSTASTLIDGCPASTELPSMVQVQQFRVGGDFTAGRMDCRLLQAHNRRQHLPLYGPYCARARVTSVLAVPTIESELFTATHIEDYPMTSPKAALALALLMFSLPVFSEDVSKAVPGGYPAIELFSSGEDVLGRSLRYPDCEPLITSRIITMAPGQTGKVHQHLTPLYAYMLSGKIKVSYEDPGKTTNTYSAGDALMEAMHIDHHGFNPFDEPARLLTVYMDCQSDHSPGK
jgi:quercetin dioxygenase-like cupin family protein